MIKVNKLILLAIALLSVLFLSGCNTRPLNEIIKQSQLEKCRTDWTSIYEYEVCQFPRMINMVLHMISGGKLNE